MICPNCGGLCNSFTIDNHGCKGYTMHETFTRKAGKTELQFDEALKALEQGSTVYIQRLPNER